MSFCSTCGQELAACNKFCPNCGTSSNNTNGNTGRATVYEGEIHKCPNCGETLGSFSLNCPSCEYELRGTKSSYSVREFSFKLENSRSEEHSVSLIKNFPIPNTKEDVLEFMILASSNLLGDISFGVFDAWQVKFEQSYQKAKLLIENENEFLKIQKIYDKTTKKINKTKTTQWIKSAGGAIVKSGMIFPRLLRLVFKNLLLFLGILSFCRSIHIDRMGDNGVGFELLGGILLIIGCSLLMRKQVSYFELAVGVGCDVLVFYLSSFLYNGAGLQLLGAISFILILISFVKKITAGNTERGE